MFVVLDHALIALSDPCLHLLDAARDALLEQVGKGFADP
jgi:hypothetical protein